MSHRILIADDHSIIRKGLKLFMQLNLGQKDITEVGSCHELMQELKRRTYSHLILDIVLSDGSSLEVIPNIKNLYPELNIVIFSMQPEEIYAEATRQMGIRYYLSKSTGEEEMQNYLDAFFKNEISEPLLESHPKKHNPFTALAPRELEILHYLLKGMRTKEIAANINLKMNTVSTLKTRIHAKTQTKNLKELLDLASIYNLSY
jgi:DNA-binding NarL/FixJ family response regulator